MFQRSAFSLMNAFHAEPPPRRLAERGHVRRADRPSVGVYPEIPAADEVEPGVIEVVVRPIVHRDTLRRQSVPVVQVPRKQSGHARTLVVAEVVPAHLAVVVRKPVRKRLRLREQQHPHVLVDVACEEHDVRGLKIFVAVLEIVDAADPTVLRRPQWR